jgi:demethylmenaquinone methyltransferase/2-methoxy-6-polyprenyl-1,4-benzoquinol methylase
MFDRVASVYDPINTAMTAGLHHRWRARAADLARVGPGSRVLDVATGTGDLAIELARRVAPGGTVVGCDFSEVMLDRARKKGEARFGAQPTEGNGNGRAPGRVNLRFEWADALDLPYPDGAFDAATTGFSLRNFADIGRGLAEMARVTRPGGRVVVLEMTSPVKPPLSFFYGAWFDRVVPLIGRLAALSRFSRGGGLAEAYTYLPSSVKRFPGPRELAAQMSDVGLSEISYVLTAGGIIAIHAATVPG